MTLKVMYNHVRRFTGFVCQTALVFVLLLSSEHVRNPKNTVTERNKRSTALKITYPSITEEVIKSNSMENQNFWGSKLPPIEVTETEY